MRWVKVALFTVLGFAALIGVLGVFGVRFQTDGSGLRPMPYVDRTASRMAEIEKRAAEDHQVETAAKQPAPVVETPQAQQVSAPWPGFYGPRRDGVYRDGPILTAWPAKGLPRIWKRPVGLGYGSMAIAQGLVFTLEQRRDEEAAVAYDLKTGREVWSNRWKAFFQESMGGDGPRSTPAWDEGRVYFLGAEGEFRCVDATSGKTIWNKNLLTESSAPNLQWGMASSPLVVENLVIMESGKGVTAYDKRTGAKVWNALDDAPSYTAPMLATLGGQQQIIAVLAKRAVGLTLQGKLLWEFPWVTEYDTNSALPIVTDATHLLLTAGYGHGSALLEVTANGVKELWTSKALKSKFNNAVLYQGTVYGMDDGILAAMDVATGQRRWKGGRYGFGQLLLAGDHLVILSETGEIALVKASPEKHQEIARFEAIEGKTWNVPAMAEGNLLVRNGAEMACYRISK
jgi:outer membrane protein assembly factor BamB